MLRETDNCQWCHPTLDPSCHYQVPTVFLLTLTFVSQPLPPVLTFPLGRSCLFQILGPTLLRWLYNQFPFPSTFPSCAQDCSLFAPPLPAALLRNLSYSPKPLVAVLIFLAAESISSNDILPQTLIYIKTSEQDCTRCSTQDPFNLFPPSPPPHHHHPIPHLGLP